MDIADIPFSFSENGIFSEKNRLPECINQPVKRLERPFLVSADRFDEPGYLTGFGVTPPINAHNEAFHWIDPYQKL